ADGRTVTRKPLKARELEFRRKSKRQQNFRNVVAVVFPVVKKYVSQARADECSKNGPDEKRIEFVEGFALSFKNLFHDVPAQCKCNDKHEAVIANHKKAEINALRGVPNQVHRRWVRA